MFRRRFFALAALISGLGLGVAAPAQEGSPQFAAVAGYERLAEEAGVSDAELGQLLLGELNCLSCHHSPSGEAVRVSTKPAPDLRRVAGRVSPGWLRDFIADPHSVKPGTTMPSLLAGHDPLTRGDLAEDLTHFLVSQSVDPAPDPREAFRFRAAVERGRDLFHRVGCVACHTAEAEDATERGLLPLPDTAAKYHRGGLEAFLRDPQTVRYASRMPSLHLADGEVEDLAVYLLRGQVPARADYSPGFEFEYFTHPIPLDIGSYRPSAMPALDLDGLMPDERGRVDRVTLNLPVERRRRFYSIRYSGLLQVDQPGAHTFTVSSDRYSESTLFVAGESVATKASGSLREASAEVTLDAGLHSISIEYFVGEPFGPTSLAATLAPAGDRAVGLGRMVVSERILLGPSGDAGWIPDAERAARGRRAFGTLGCGSCHALSSAGTDTRAAVGAPDLDRLVTEAVRSGNWRHFGERTPRYELSDHQRMAIGAALGDLAALRRPREPESQVRHTLATFNCYGCHVRDDVGGPTEARHGYFRIVGNQDLGDEGRFPPRSPRSAVSSSRPRCPRF